jgi:hypothetical protein
LWADEDLQTKPELDVYAQERATHDMQRAQMATGGLWDHPTTRKVSTAGNDNNGRLGKVIGEAAPIRKGRGFGKPAGIEKSAKKCKTKKNDKNEKTKQKQLMRHATEIGLAVLKAVNTAGNSKAKTGHIAIDINISSVPKMALGAAKAKQTKNKKPEGGQAGKTARSTNRRKDILGPKKGNGVQKTGSSPRQNTILRVTVSGETVQQDDAKRKRRCRKKNNKIKN